MELLRFIAGTVNLDDLLDLCIGYFCPILRREREGRGRPSRMARRVDRDGR
jgi:hypothetical protein